ncbi:MAG: biotin transporter BioY [Clostridia bacterium]|nr:biotin transporter BioY [Clostridia bacterium]
MSNSRGSSPILRLCCCALFVALTAVCAQLIIPIGAVPVSLSLLPVLLCGCLLPLPDALAAMGAYLLLGLAGVPVFSGLGGGPAKLLGPTGGYLVGYLPCVLITGLFIRRSRDSVPLMAAGMVLGILACYALGTAWFVLSTGTGWSAALSVCVLPFLPFDAVKVALAVVLVRALTVPLRPVMPWLRGN